jgi:hypothetical protein
MSKEDLYHRGSGVAVSVNLAVVYRQIDQLTPDPANPRRHSKKQIRQIADSIKTFGFNVPVLVDADLNVKAGMAGSWPAANSASPRCRRCASITSPRRRPAPS